MPNNDLTIAKNVLKSKKSVVKLKREKLNLTWILIFNINNNFNNNANIHGNITNFNNVTQFGYNLIQGNTNGPGLNDAAQSYSWDIGLGTNYGFGTYMAQFAVPRNV